MSNGNRQVDFNFKAKLAALNIAPADREEALAAVEKAETLIAAVEYLGSALKRLTEAVQLKPRVRA